MRTVSRVPDRRESGFTLIELIVMLVLVSVLLSLAVPSMSGYIDKTTTRRALDHVVADISYARMYAVQRATRAAVQIDGSTTYRIDTLSLSGSWAALKSVDLNRDFKGAYLGGSVTRLEFDSRGILSNLGNESHLTVSRSGAMDSVYVSPAGRVYRGY